MCAAFHKIKYFDIVNISKFLTTLIRSREKQVLMLAFGRGRWAVFSETYHDPRFPEVSTSSIKKSARSYYHTRHA